MSYNVQAGFGGYTGWKILERTMPRQRDVFLQNLEIKSSKDYFSYKMPDVKTAEQLVSDHRLLTVILRAFGLDGDVNNKFFIRKILESDPGDKASLVNRLADKRYLKMNQALSLNVAGEGAWEIVNIAEIIEKYETRSFEKNIGQRYSEIELALNAQREIQDISDSNISENAKWYQILASKPLRRIFEVAFGLGDRFASLPIDRQLSELKVRTGKFLGDDSVSQFKVKGKLDSIIRMFLLRDQIRMSSIGSRYTNALVLLTSWNR
ncbi:DUF1217 domain-containing protein [Paracoccus sp. (in: a-proteobacteria)]|uniref:DUF1217 domain-containing protein n=1 Tax=Paracoccus sp. TaxID=267 RepID=UPI0028B0C22D|nr:DUF1217 domain-containing protein [Paracoccus sp. (in: a-proteobacteria)]